MEDVVEQLEGPVESDLHPTRRLLDALSAIVRTPPLHKAESEDTETPEIIDSDAFRHVGLDSDVASCHVACRRREGLLWLALGQIIHFNPSTADIVNPLTSDSGCLGSDCGTSFGGLFLHLAVTLVQVKHLARNKNGDMKSIIFLI